jgi:hypothetical protein
MEMSGRLHASTALSRGKGPRYKLDMRGGGPQRRSGRCGEEEISAPAGTRTLIVQLVA